VFGSFQPFQAKRHHTELPASCQAPISTFQKFFSVATRMHPSQFPTGLEGAYSLFNALLSGLSKAVLQAREDYTDPKGIVKLSWGLSKAELSALESL
jgi:hypothetical protein